MDSLLTVTKKKIIKSFYLIFKNIIWYLKLILCVIFTLFIRIKVNIYIFILYIIICIFINIQIIIQRMFIIHLFELF